MIENYVHWNEDIGEWQLVSSWSIARVTLVSTLILEVQTDCTLSCLFLCCLSEMRGIHWQQHEKTDTCTRQKRKRCKFLFDSLYIFLILLLNQVLLTSFFYPCLLQPFEVDLSHVYLAYTEESMRQSLMKLERPRTSKSSKSGRPKTGRR